jgi:hypothetical protein
VAIRFTCVAESRQATAPTICWAALHASLDGDGYGSAEARMPTLSGPSTSTAVVNASRRLCFFGLLGMFYRGFTQTLKLRELILKR